MLIEIVDDIQLFLFTEFRLSLQKLFVIPDVELESIDIHLD